MKLAIVYRAHSLFIATFIILIDLPTYVVLHTKEFCKTVGGIYQNWCRRTWSNMATNPLLSSVCSVKVEFQSKLKFCLMLNMFNFDIMHFQAS